MKYAIIFLFLVFTQQSYCSYSDLPIEDGSINEIINNDPIMGGPNCCVVNPDEIPLKIKEEEDKELNIVLSNVGNIVVSFIKIVQNPHDGENVGTEVNHMASSIINIAKEIVRRHPNLADEELEPLVNEITPAIKNAIFRAIREQALLIPDEINEDR